MAKVQGTFKSLVRGVSEQVPHDRLEGQHYEQVNFVSDPIRGLIRRRGSRFLDKLPISPPAAGYEDRIKNYREHSFTAAGVDYAILYPGRPSPAGGPVVLFNKDTQTFVPVSLSTAAAAQIPNGISGAVSVGRYLLLSVRGYVPTVDRLDTVEDTASNAAIWVRGGAYSRTYRITYGATSASYTTPKSYYEGTLDTSDIPHDDPEYQKKINDRVNAYQTAVNQYIANAQQAIQPANIAEQLKVRLQAEGIECGRAGSHIHVYNLPGSGTLTGDDGGDGEFLRVTHREVGSLNDLTRQHVVGVTVRVEVTADEVYYVRAFAKDPGGPGFQEVIWREWTGEEVTVTNPFLIGTVHNGTMYIGFGSSDLEAHLPSGHGLTVPSIVERKAGDDETNPLPDFFERPISYMTVFQDRLVICSGANVFMSAPSDYFNWFRKSALRVDPDDPIEVYALGAEDDVIRGGATIDRNLILTGDSLHYAVSGRDAITPLNAIVSVQAANESTTDAQPRSLGNLLFYSQYQGGVTKLHQMQVGAFADSFGSFSVTQQVEKYIKGRPRQLVTSSQPNMVLMSTEGNEYGLYVFTFLDSPGQEQRLFDSWSRWEWSVHLGRLLGMTSSDEGFTVFTVRETPQGWRVVADEFSRDSGLDDVPYFDSHTEYTNVDNRAAPLDSSECAAALGRLHPRHFYGKPLGEIGGVLSLSDVRPEDVYVGTRFDSYYEPTAPYPRDRDDNALLSGRTVLTNLGLTLAESAGISVELAGRGGNFDQTILDDAGFRINDPLSPLGAVPLTDRRVSAYIGKEIREHRLRISSKTWTPLNIATVEWTIQTFNRR